MKKEKGIINMERTKKTPHRRYWFPKQNGTALRLLSARQDMRLVRIHIQIEYIVLFTLPTMLVLFLYQMDPAGTEHREDKKGEFAN